MTKELPKDQLRDKRLSAFMVEFLTVSMNVSLQDSVNDKLMALHKRKERCIRASEAIKKILQFFMAKLQIIFEILSEHYRFCWHNNTI